MTNDDIEKVDLDDEGNPIESALKKDDDGEPTDPNLKKDGDQGIRPEETPEARKSRLERQLEQHKKKHPELYSEPTKKDNGKQSDDLDYGAKGYLASNGIKGNKELDFVKKELKASGADIDTLLENPYFQARLADFRETTKTEEANPKGKRDGGGAPIDSVEFWLTKPIEEVPQDMRQKVVNAKLAREQNKGAFYNS